MSKIAYTIPEAAVACGVSEPVIRRAHAKGDIVYHYPTSRPVIMADDLRDWLASKPVEIAKEAS
jgi:hypothetical protein